MKMAVLEMAGTVGAVRKEIGAERGRIDSLTSLVLPRLDTMSGAVEELWKQMTEHRRYCGEILRELQGYATAGLQHLRNMGVDAVQNVAEQEGSDTGTAEYVGQEDSRDTEASGGGADASGGCQQRRSGGSVGGTGWRIQGSESAGGDGGCLG